MLAQHRLRHRHWLSPAKAGHYRGTVGHYRGTVGYYRVTVVSAFRRTNRIPVDAQPVHLAPAEHLLAADHRHVVLGLAGDHAGAAADARAKIDRHRPLMRRGAVGERCRRLVQGQCLRPPLRLQVLELLQRQRAHRRRNFERAMELREREVATRTGHSR